MEHNLEKLLQSKILLEERNPLPWRKEATWERIQAGGETRRKHRLTYYAYAACILIVALVIYGRDRHNRMTLDDRIDAAAVCIDDLTTSRTPIAANMATPDACASTLSSNTTTAEHAKRTSPVIVDQSSVPSPPRAIKEDVSHQVAAVAPTSTATSEPTLDTGSTEKRPVHKVRPIIGVVIEQAPAPLMADKKKKSSKIKFFPYEKDAPILDVPEPATLTARIN